VEQRHQLSRRLRPLGAHTFRSVAEARLSFLTFDNNLFLFRMQVPAAAQQLTQVLSKLRHTFVVADATLPDCPLVYASES
jgi:hypothetical protein